MARRKRRLGVLLAGTALAPTAACAAWAACTALGRAAAGAFSGGDRAALPFLAGLAVYPVVHLLLKPSRLYVFGHELAHGAAAVLSGVRVRRMKVGREGGHVELDRINPFIALAPYLIPLYTVLWLSCVRLVGVWRPVPAWILAAGVGATLAFHILLTAETLWLEHQTDLDQAGGIFGSIVLIVLANSLVLPLALKGLYPHAVSLEVFASSVAAGTAAFWQTAARLAMDGVAWAFSEGAG